MDRKSINGGKQRAYVRGVFTNCLKVTIGVLQESVLGSSLFLVCVNDLADRIQIILKFVCIAKIVSEIRNNQNCNNLQRDLKGPHH